MSLKLNSSGGGSVTLQEPVTASTLTLTLPAFSGTAATLASVTNNGVLFVNSSGQPTSGSALTFDGSFLGVAGYLTLTRSGKSLYVNPNFSGSNTYADIQTDTGMSLAFSPSGSEQMRLTSTGLGIGTSSPSRKLSVYDTSSIPVRIETNTSDTKIEILTTSGTQYIQASANNLLFGTSNTERARIDSSGNLLVGTTIVQQGGRLSIANTVNNVCVGLYASGTGNTTGTYLNCGDDFAVRFRVYTNGNAQNANNSYGSTSDIKLKENIVDATPKLENLNQVRIVNYNLIGDTQKQIGVIAQELEQVFPGMVEESPDRDAQGNDLGTTTKSVKYSVFVPMLIKAIQELKAEFDAYKATHP